MSRAPSGSKVGVYLGAERATGGTFQYGLSILDGLIPLADEGSGLSAISRNAETLAATPTTYRKVLLPQARFRRAIAASVRRLDVSPSGVRRSSRFDPLPNAIDELGLDLVLFPGQDLCGAQIATPSLVSVHDLMHRYERGFGEYSDAEYARREARFGAISRFASGVLVDSDLGKRQMLESYGGDGERIHILPFVIPPYMQASERVDVRSKYGLFDRYLFYPAQFWEHKNHARLLKALDSARSAGVEINLVLVGEPKNGYPAVVELISELELGSQVQILGYVPDGDMSSLYRESIGTVFVSLIGPTSIPPLEALAAGSPLVAGRRYAIEEQVGDAALFVDPLDVEDIARGIVAVWSDSVLRADLIERGLERSACWTPSDFARRLREVVGYMIALEGSSHG